GQVIETTTRQPLGDYLKANLFIPLGMTDTGFYVAPEKASRYTKPLPADPDTGKPQVRTPELTEHLKFECGGGCAESTASDYLRFVNMLMNGGRVGEKQILGRKTVEYMLSNQIGPEIRNLVGNADPTRADYGFGLGLAVRTTPGVVRMLGSVGQFSWPGSTGTDWWADPKEDLIVVYLSAAPGPLRWHYRQKINALVYQALE
ncbi:MAG: beta-lactamase family protein, partial [Xanthobacteraceae bacterium]|nr:beta-lactamase family protein [Xanthobacteraceae bacterium]